MSVVETATASTLNQLRRRKIMHTQSCSELQLVRDGSGYQKGLIFGKVPRGGGSFSNQKSILQILDL